MSLAKRLLLVDDDTVLRETLAEQLAAQGEFAVSHAASGAEALAATAGQNFDLLMLDVGLPDTDGRDLCRRLRESGIRAPVIMLTAADGADDTVRGLDAGANDYVSKPFKLAVLLARIRAQLRQYEQSDDAIFVIGPYEFRPAAKQLLDTERKGRKVRLTEKEATILKYLYRTGGDTVSRDTLLAEVWGYNAGVTTHTLETHVYRLRQKIERDPSRAALLLTDGGGYKLVR
jgi:DNA-binding response OmpR family regulator